MHEAQQGPPYIPAHLPLVPSSSLGHPLLLLFFVYIRALPFPSIYRPEGPLSPPVLSPLLVPLSRFARFAQRHGYFCCSLRCLSFYSCCILPLSRSSSLLFRTVAPVLVPPAMLGFSLSRDSFLLFLLLLLICPSPPCLELARLLLLFSSSERDIESD